MGVDAFVPATVSSRCISSESSPSCLFAGMGMAAKPKGGKKGGNSKKNSSGTKATPFDAAASLIKMEKVYMEMSAKSAKVLAKKDDDIRDDDMMLSEFVIAARAGRSSTATSDLTAVFDWIPVAQLCLARPMTAMENSEGPKDKVVRAAISYYCREISHAAVFGASKFRDVPRQEMLYSVESLDSFGKYVRHAINGKKKDKEDSMTKTEARKVLKLEEGASDKSQIKQAYRKLSFAFHPDRFVGVDRTEEEAQASNDEFALVKIAYDTMSSGVNDGKSWYQSLGGKERTEFFPVDLLPINDAKAILDSIKHDSAVVGLDKEITQMFVVRNQNAKVSV